MLKSSTIPTIAKSSHVDDNYQLNDFIDSLIEEGAIPPQTLSWCRDKKLVLLPSHLPTWLRHNCDGLTVLKDGITSRWADYCRRCGDCGTKASFECRGCNKGLQIASKTDLPSISCSEKFHSKPISAPPEVGARVVPLNYITAHLGLSEASVYTCLISLISKPDGLF